MAAILCRGQWAHLLPWLCISVGRGCRRSNCQRGCGRLPGHQRRVWGRSGGGHPCPGGVYQRLEHTETCWYHTGQGHEGRHSWTYSIAQWPRASKTTGWASGLGQRKLHFVMLLFYLVFFKASFCIFVLMCIMHLRSSCYTNRHGVGFSFVFFQNPPAIIKLVMESVCVMLGEKAERKPDPSSGKMVEDYWGPSQKLLGDMRFLDRLKTYDKDNINAQVMAKIRKT